MIKCIENKELQHYEVYENEAMIGRVEYKFEGDQMILTMIYVEPNFRGQKKAGIIAKETYDWLKSKKQQVTVTCHVLHSMYSSEEYQDILLKA